MLINQTLEKLHTMRLTGMAEALNQQLQDPDSTSLSFEERISFLVDRHWIWRENKALARRLTNAKLKDRQACLEDINYRQPRGLDRSLIRSLGTCDWVARHQNLILIGPCGVGKTFLACAFAQQAIRQGHHGILHPPASTLSRPGSGPGRRHTSQAAGLACSSRSLDRRRLGDDRFSGERAPRLPRDL